MRKFFRFLRRLVLLAALILVVGYLVAAPEPVDSTVAFDEASLPADLDAYLAADKAKYGDIVPGTEKQIVWNGTPGLKTAFSVVYLHGFSATLHEIRPVPDKVSQALGANLFYTRLAGHGRGSAAMAEPNAGDWIEDMAEALAIGRRIGERVIVISTSTGGTLAAIAATDPALSADVAGMVFVSPNFGIDAIASFVLGMPYARYWGPYVFGSTRSFAPQNPSHERYWTTSYPTVAVFPMEALVRYALKQDYRTAKTPALFIYSLQDKVVRPDVTTGIVAAWGGPKAVLNPILGVGDDPYSHILAGDILSPSQTDPTVARILSWAGGL